MCHMLTTGTAKMHSLILVMLLRCILTVFFTAAAALCYVNFTAAVWKR